MFLKWHSNNQNKEVYFAIPIQRKFILKHGDSVIGKQRLSRASTWQRIQEIQPNNNSATLNVFGKCQTPSRCVKKNRTFNRELFFNRNCSFVEQFYNNFSNR